MTTGILAKLERLQLDVLGLHDRFFLYRNVDSEEQRQQLVEEMQNLTFSIQSIAAAISCALVLRTDGSPR